ncbi:MAG: ATP-binding cassette domain-containing protein, partial [Planctomycetota bacterium]|nr:ATP-binding cassette domain-containing protein [Planctomycetota bacterium]
MNQDEDSTREPETLGARQEFVDEPSRLTPADASSPMELRLDSVTISTPSKQLIEDANETIAAGRITLIVGPSGAGKSVLLRTLAGLLPQSGESISWTVEIHLSNDSGTRLNPKGNVGVVFQQFALFDELSCTANIQFAIDHRSTGKRSKRTNSANQNRSATQWLDQLG